MITLTSFRDALNHSGLMFSVARSSPRMSIFMSLGVLSARDIDGKPLIHIAPRDYVPMYFRKLVEGERAEVLLTRFAKVSTDSVLACWCNPDRQKGYDHLFCHTILIGWWLEKHFPELLVVYADGRDREWFGDLHISECRVP